MLPDANALRRKLPQIGIAIAFLLMVIVFSTLSPVFFTYSNFINIANQTAIISVLAFGMTLVMLAGGIDLSVGSIVSLSAVICALLLGANVATPIAMGASLLTGMAFGAASGFISARWGVQTFLVTLGALSIARGLSLVLIVCRTVDIESDVFLALTAQGFVGPVPVLFAWTLFFFALSWVVLNLTTFGRKVRAVGGNIVAARHAVRNTNRVGSRVCMRSGGLVQAHGTGTPQNRVTESKILSETAKAFGIKDWQVAALKSYIGHSLGSASGDQMTTTLGIWKHGLIPGIHSIDAVADDVVQDGLSFSKEHREIDPEALHYTIINSKGFGGNNATGTMLSPAVTRKMMQARYSASEWKAWEKANEAVRERQQKYDDDMIAGTEKPVYKFDHNVLGDDDVELAENEMHIAGKRVGLDLKSPYDDMKIEP